jgi:branched-chain amino acid transport system substrate-binding protein
VSVVTFRRLIPLVAVLALAGVGCGGEEAGSGGSGSGSDAAAGSGDEVAQGGENLEGKEVKIGFLVGLTGDYSAFTGPITKAAQIATKDINDAGGILGGPAKLVIQDNKSTSEGAVSGFEKLTQVDKVVAIGGVESDGGVAILERAAEQKIPVICSFCGTPILDTKGGDFMWRFTASDTDGGTASAQFARDRKYKTVGILAQEGEVGRPADVFKRSFQEKAGGKVLSDVRFDPGKSSYQVEVQQAFKGNPDAVYLAAGHQEAASILPEWQRRKYGGEFFVSPDLITPETTFDFLEDGVGTGVIAAFDEDTPAYKEFAKKYEAVTGDKPSQGLGEPLNYDTIIAIALAVTAAKSSTDGQKIRDGMVSILNPPGKVCYLYAECVKLLEGGEEIDYYGSSTSLDLNDKGNLKSPTMSQIQLVDGEWKPTSTIELDSSLRP